MIMIFVGIICLLLTLGYVGLIITYMRGWVMQKEFRVPKGFSPHTKISVIIPARNEQNNIVSCIESILNQNYPLNLYEIIVVDDNSVDETPDIVKSYINKNVKYISLKEYLGKKVTKSYKKAAITAGISNSIGELIITTDADCFAQQNWLMHFAAKYEVDKPIMIIAPVIYTYNNSLLQIFQLIDFMSMQGITVAAHTLGLGNMCNGANLAFTKKAFDIVGGYEGVDHIATGDDYLLMMKFTKLQGNRIEYLKAKDAIISTLPQENYSSLMQQRIRWASKSGKYDDKRLTYILVLVYLFNFSFLMLLIGGGVVMYSLFYIAITMLVLKIIIEYLFLIQVSKFYSETRVLWLFLFLQPLHILYIIIAGFFGMVGKYEWKGRKIK